jgi:hypothetical protein
VDLFDETAGPAQVQLERWTFDPLTLKRLLRKDIIGWGYTLFLPWSTYRPEIAVVRLKLCYQPKNGSPLYAESAVTLNDKEGNAKGPPLAKKPGAAPVTTSGPKAGEGRGEAVGATTPAGPQPWKSGARRIFPWRHARRRKRHPLNRRTRWIPAERQLLGSDDPATARPGGTPQHGGSARTGVGSSIVSPMLSR